MKPTEQTNRAPSFGTPSSLLSAIKFEDSSDNDSVDSEYELFTKDLAAFSDEPSPNNADDPEFDDMKSVSTEKRLAYEEGDFVIKEETEINELVTKDESDISPVVLQPRTISHSQQRTEGDDFVIKDETEINGLVPKDELDINPVVLQPRTISHSQPSTEAQPPGTSVDGDAAPAPSDAYDTTDHIPIRKWQIQRTYAKKAKMKSSNPVGDRTVSVQSELVCKVEGEHYGNDCEGLRGANSSLRIDTDAADAANNTEGQCEPKQSSYNAYEKSCREMYLILRTVDKQHKCEYCGYMSSRLSNMDIHMRKHTGERPYQCKRCDYRASQLSNLRIHMRKHTGEKPYQCKRCEYRASRLDLLKIHMHKHTKKKPYQCEQCEYAGSRLNSLRSHMRIHTDVNSYQCKQCEYVTSHIGNLRRHLRIHTGEKPYQCNMCKYTSSHLCALRNHMRTHTGEKPYQCKQCEYKASQMSNLRRHMLKHTANGVKSASMKHLDFVIYETTYTNVRT